MFEDNTRVVEYEVDGAKFSIQVTDPYGFCVVTPSSGRTPEVFKQNKYTTPDDAKRAITTYVKSRAPAKETVFAEEVSE